MFSTLDIRISGEASAFLRTVRHAGGSLHVDQGQFPLVKECVANSLVVFTGDAVGGGFRAELLGRGYAYLDRLMRAH
ncbi:hypothetical protein E5S70_07310 [Ensifer adhaerens]|uniref:hypothetical protein n=1 Tax=Ensifer canadensis TaxID=555315 RepID=UPI00148FFB11|nr:hypothetical protein [Ensifer canadensis]NOV15893.1 hypothetical protein [Ensifer canadensis]